MIDVTPPAVRAGSKILHFAATDGGGGAAKATMRLHQALRAAGHRSKMLVRQKQTDDPDVAAVPYRFDRWRHRRRRLSAALRLRECVSVDSRYMFNRDEEADLDFSAAQLYRGEVDVIILHWITDFLTVDHVAQLNEVYRCPILWLLMDQEPLTGGCHYSFDCLGYTRSCGNCPQIKPSHPTDLSHRTWRRKQDLLKPIPMTFIAANSNAHRLITASSLFGKHRIANIPVPVDTSIFRPFDRLVARQLLNVPTNRSVLFFGAAAMDCPRKGVPFLLEALRMLNEIVNAEAGDRLPEIFVVVAGRQGESFIAQQPFPGTALGYLRDDLTLALAYQAANLYICPSVEDGGPMMIAESMLCGTPVVAFRSGMAPDLITSMENGYLANFKDSRDLARGVFRLLTHPDRPKVARLAHEAAYRAHASENVVRQYEGLFSETALLHANASKSNAAL